ncbi:hypothetical protein [uncultured Williamsia sp.]|uniref:hypothetical protein n=1 Tax=uncultured Williamsia sp. TaxID=259311 RepID=UPI002624BA77|nr:hypothetical protein [uncultured Williamsia sp.]
MALSVGTHLRTPSSAAEVIVVRGPDVDGELQCHGGVMGPDATAGDVTDPDAPQLAMGKRYTDEATGLEVLIVKPGAGPLAFAGRELALREAKPLPASD